MEKISRVSLWVGEHGQISVQVDRGAERYRYYSPSLRQAMTLSYLIHSLVGQGKGQCKPWIGSVLGWEWIREPVR